MIEVRVRKNNKGNDYRWCVEEFGYEYIGDTTSMWYNPDGLWYYDGYGHPWLSYYFVNAADAMRFKLIWA